MAFKYRRGQNDFFAIGPANEIRETQHGNAAGGIIIYPGVSTCTTVTLMLADGTALGMHLAKIDLTGDVDAIVNEVNVIRAGRAVTTLYAVGVLICRSAGGWMAEARYKWPSQLTTFNTAFGRNPGDPVQGYIQKENTDFDYRALVGGGAVSWCTRPNGTATWNSLTLKSL